MLQQSGLTGENLNAYLRTEMFEQSEIVNDIKKTQYTDSNMKKIWETYHTEVTASKALKRQMLKIKLLSI